MKIERISENSCLRDEETNSYSADYLADCLEKERHKARRFRRPFSLIFLAVDNHASLLAQTGESAVAAALSEMIETIRKLLRASVLLLPEPKSRLLFLLDVFSFELRLCPAPG